MAYLNLGAVGTLGQFQLLDDEIFNQLSEHRAAPDIIDELQYNYCPNCKIVMELSSSEYQCRACGLTKANEFDMCKDHHETITSSIRITTGSNKGRFYNINGDYTKTQRKMVLDQLMQLATHYPGPAFPLNILNAVANQYNHIQRLITEDDLDENGNVRGQKKFVRRGNIKDEVLAGLIYFECIREKLVRKKKDIAAFMKLTTNGFARGEDILRTLEAEGKLDIPVDDEPIEGFVDRYMCALDIENPTYSQFVIDLVQRSEDKNIGMNSQISSKIVGAIWILIQRKKLGISAQALERAADNTKKNTFAKFSNMVMNNMGVFKDIFTTHGI